MHSIWHIQMPTFTLFLSFVHSFIRSVCVSVFSFASFILLLFFFSFPFFPSRIIFFSLFCVRVLSEYCSPIPNFSCFFFLFAQMLGIKREVLACSFHLSNKLLVKLLHIELPYSFWRMENMSTNHQISCALNSPKILIMIAYGWRHTKCDKTYCKAITCN